MLRRAFDFPSARLLLVGAVATASLIASACGSDTSVFGDGPVDAEAPDASSAGDAASAPDGTQFVPGPDAGPECVSALLCGTPSVCCALNQECVQGACSAACASGTRCGAACCNAGDVCLGGACTTPGSPCEDSFDCNEAQFCEPTLKKCLPQPDGGASCQLLPTFAPLNPIVEWQWPLADGGAAVKPGFENIINMAVVIDGDQNGTPDVYVVTSSNTGSSGFPHTETAYLRRLDGKTGLEQWTDVNTDVYKAENEVNPRGTPAAGRLTPGGPIAIVVPRKGGGVLAFNAATGARLWAATTPLTDGGASDYNGSFLSATVAIADMDPATDPNGPGYAEVVVGGIVLNHHGALVDRTMAGQTRFDGGGARERWGANDFTYGPVSVVADVDGDPNTTEQFVVTGNGAYRKNGTALWQRPEYRDGYTAVANLDNAGAPELVVVSDGRVRVHNATNGALLAERDFTLAGQDRNKNRGGPPTVADFDGDGTMEFSSAGGYSYNVFKYHPAGDGGPGLITVLWSAPTKDLSSNVTGSSVFDFEGDGVAEVVYSDECFSRVYQGRDGGVLFSVPNTSATIHEYPILVDVDGDNNTEFVTVANIRPSTVDGDCAAQYGDAGLAARRGVFVYGDANDRWVRTRRVWNQHSYHITNIEVSGGVPAPEPPSFGPSGFNNYRVSSQGKGVGNAPDLRVDFEVSTASCPATLLLRARVTNQGSLGVAPGVKVEFFAGTDATAPLLAAKATTKVLLPGQSEVVSLDVPGQGSASSYFVRVDGAGGVSLVQECLEDNNSAGATGIRCPTVR